MFRKTEKYPLVAIIIVNWNGRKYLEGCLGSISGLHYPRNKIKIILVDNGSTDDSASWTYKNFPNVVVKENKVNLGFAKGNNIGIREALRDIKTHYIITLNSDIEVDKNWLQNLVDFMDRNKEVGIAVGKILQFYDRGKIDSVGDFISKDNYRVINRGHDYLNQGQFDKPVEIFSACAAASIFRREVLEQIQINGEFFDEDFVSYIEDVDLNVRARLRNWLCYYVPDAITYHIGSATSIKVSKVNKEFLSRRNRLLMTIKNFPLRNMLFLLGKYILPSKKGIKYYSEKKGDKAKPDNDTKLTFGEASLVHTKAIFSALKLLPKMIRKRRIIQRNKKISNKEIERWFKKLVISQ